MAISNDGTILRNGDLVPLDITNNLGRYGHSTKDTKFEKQLYYYRNMSYLPYFLIIEINYPVKHKKGNYGVLMRPGYISEYLRNGRYIFYPEHPINGANPELVFRAKLEDLIIRKSWFKDARKKKNRILHTCNNVFSERYKISQ